MKIKDLIFKAAADKKSEKLAELGRLLKEYDHLKQQVKKDELFFGLVVVLWLLCLLYFDPRLFRLYSSFDPLYIKTVIIFTIVCLNIFWFYTSYLVTTFFFTIFLRFPYLSPSLTVSSQSKVAFLYTTVNDFDYAPAMTCINQDYGNFHVFLLDDSNDESFKARVDAFHAEFPDKTTVIRRKERTGFKGGAINNCVFNYAKDFDYIAIADADSIFSSDFLSKAIPCFGLDERIGFVQASHQYNPNQEGTFARDLGLGVNIHWRKFVPPRNRYGFVMFFGHGGVIRRDVLEKIGGFPEIVCEDLAFSCVARQHGYYGFFLPDVVCYEDFPHSMMAFRKRHYRWVKGTIEYAFWGLPSFFRAKGVSWAEKLDVLLICLGISFPTLLLLFMVATAIITFSLGYSQEMTVTLGDMHINLWPIIIVPRFVINTAGADFYILTVIAIFAPALFIIDLKTNFFRTLKFFAQATTAYPALIVISAISTLSIFITGKAYFTVTGAKGLRAQEGKTESKRLSIVEWVNRLNADNKYVMFAEIVFALVSLWFCIVSYNIGLLTIVVGIIINVLTAIYGWENRYLHPLTYIPVFFVVFAMSMISVLQIAATPVIYSLIPVHM